MKRIALTFVIAFVGCFLGQGHSRSRQVPRLEFEVASIKPSVSDDRSMTMTMRPGGRFTATNVSAKMLIKVAYGLFLPWPGGPGPVAQRIGMSVPSSFVVPDSQVDGGEQWANSDKFDIECKAEVPVRNEIVLMMLRSLLEDRFKLKMHSAQREMQAYLLVVAPNGVKMERVSDDGTGEGGAGMGTGKLMGRKMSVPTLLRILSSDILDRPVVDRTNLSGFFNVALNWTPDELLRTGAGAESGAAGPSIFTAIQEQLGLRLERGRSLVDVLMIDRLERPTLN